MNKAMALNSNLTLTIAFLDLMKIFIVPLLLLYKMMLSIAIACYLSNVKVVLMLITLC
jgi:hypothetical protein